MSEAAMNINMDSELMLPLRTDIDGILNRTLKTMHSTGNGEAVVTAKIKISLAKEGLPTKDGIRHIIKPTFEHEVQSVVQAKDKKTGAMTGDYELVYNPDTDSWEARSTRQQITMFDKEAQVDYQPEDEVAGYIEQPAIGLPAGDDEYEDAEDEEDEDQEDGEHEAEDDPDYEEADESPDYEPDEEYPEE